MDSHLHTTHDKSETVALGKSFAEHLVAGDVVALHGDLGAGKTEFVRGICEYFHVGDIVSSPTFTIINCYTGTSPENDEEVKLYHVDLYRLNEKRELEEIGFQECANSPDSIKLIEWANKANGDLPRKRYSVIFRIHSDDEDARDIEIRRLSAEDTEEPILLDHADSSALK